MLARCALFSFALLPCASVAEPIKLKLAYFSSDRSTTYRAAVLPFLEAIKGEGQGLIEIEPHLSGALGKEIPKQPNLVLDGTADIAYVVAGSCPHPSRTTASSSCRASTGICVRKPWSSRQFVAANMLKGYEDFFVIGAFVTEPETIHSRTPIASLNDLKGKKIRVNNPGQAAGLDKLGAVPVLMPVNQIAEAPSAAAASTPPLCLRARSSTSGSAVSQPITTCSQPVCAAAAADESQGLRQPAEASAGADPQVQRAMGGGPVHRNL